MQLDSDGALASRAIPGCRTPSPARLIKPGKVLASINLNTTDLLNLKGTPLPQDANFDELRLKDVPQGTDVNPGNASTR